MDGRVDALIDRSGECWLWLGGTDRYGYGKATVGGRAWQIHRYVWTVLRGPIPAGKFLCHTCDVANCVNPEHLYVGDQRSNMDDMIRRGRSTRGVRNVTNKLSERDVRAIRRRVASGETQVAVATEYGISTIQVSRIVRRERWGWLDD